jgi:hypothetical protein
MVSPSLSEAERPSSAAACDGGSDLPATVKSGEVIILLRDSLGRRVGRQRDPGVKSLLPHRDGRRREIRVGSCLWQRRQFRQRLRLSFISELRFGVGFGLNLWENVPPDTVGQDDRYSIYTIKYSERQSPGPVHSNWGETLSLSFEVVRAVQQGST